MELVSIYALDELWGVSMDGEGTIRIGSLTSFSHITHAPIIQAHINVLGEAVDMVGGPQIRNIGTITVSPPPIPHPPPLRGTQSLRLPGRKVCGASPSRTSISRRGRWTCVLESFRLQS